VAEKDWERIRRIRPDISQYVMHCTKQTWNQAEKRMVSAAEVLTQILGDGYLRAGFSRQRSPRAQVAKPRVRGPRPAVCFTEQPLEFFLQTLSVGTVVARYSPFALAFRKDDLFDYGGRPVIYADEPALGRRTRMPNGDDDPWIYEDGLPREMQYLWVGYEPTDLWYGSYPNDWTHEREWRVRPDVLKNTSMGIAAEADVAVPVLLPTRRPGANGFSRVILLVDKRETVQIVRGWIAGHVDEISKRGRPYWRAYAAALWEADVLDFESLGSCWKARAVDLRDSTISSQQGK
jgi:hypothetical protein